MVVPSYDGHLDDPYASTQFTCREGAAAAHVPPGLPMTTTVPGSGLGPSVRNDMAHAGLLRRDERGLMPLAEARAWLVGRPAYVKGEGSLPDTDGTHVLESDRTWAALLSLADGDEFLAESRRLAWEFEAVRGFENLSVWQRYGEETTLRWVAEHIGGGGDLTNRPWCVLPCLLACTTSAAFDVAGSVRSVNGRSTRVSILAQWLLRHPEPGYAVLADRLGSGNEDAALALEELVAADPRGTLSRLAAVVGPDAAGELLARHELVVDPLPEQVRAVLDAAPVVELGPASLPVSIAEMDEDFTGFGGPIFDNMNYFCAAMRLTGFVNPGGTDGLVVQLLWTGLGGGQIKLNFGWYGFDGTQHWLNSRDLDIAGEDETSAYAPGTSATLTLPNGTATVDVTPHPEFGEELGPTETVMVAITADRDGCDRTFLTPDQLVERLSLPASVRPLFTLDHWLHPPAGAPASDSPDLVLAVEALRERRAITAAATGATRDDNLRARIQNIGGFGDAWTA